MRAMICSVLALAPVLGLALPVLGQGATAAPESGAKQPIVPYTAEFKETSVNMLANGTTITLELTEVDAIDSQGRSMFSTTNVSGYKGGDHTTRVTVSDPVAGTRTNWTSPGTTATVTILHSNQSDQQLQWDCVHSYAIPAGSSPEAASGSGTAEPARGVVGGLGATLVRGAPSDHFPDLRALQSKTKTVVEELGTTTIQGMEARGKRVTMTTEAGAVGNDQPIVKTTETWYSTASDPIPMLLLRRVSDDSQSGKSTYELVSMTLGEPDLSRFQPPEDYKIDTVEMHAVPCANAREMPIPQASPHLH
ncbi:MAG: hypothetical protein ABSC48_13115 [Terracidiphilus sp.]|jgi:hypothetical protein